MDGRDLEALERVARNLPIQHLTFGRVEGELGVVYFAYGLDGDGQYQGVWGCNRVARHIEFKRGATPKQVRHMLELDANEFMEIMHRRGCLRENFWAQ